MSSKGPSKNSGVERGVNKRGPGKQVPWPTGQVVSLPHHSNVLADNPLGDPADRTVTVWQPHDYDQRKRPLPVLYDLVGYTGSGPAHTNWQAFSENMPERLDRLYHSGKLGPCLVVFADCFTALGGNQYINSTAIGQYADYLTKELIPFVDQEFDTLASREHRACFGKSSGGYGAMVHGMRYAKHWGAVASHSGDAGFELVYATQWPEALSHLARYQKRPPQPGRYRAKAASTDLGADDGRVKNFLADFWRNDRPSGADVMCLMMVAMAATYDPDPTAPNGFRLPIDFETGERIASRWRRWLAHDPVRMVRKHTAALRTLKGIYMDCGWRDQYHIHFGNRQVSAQLTKHGVKHQYHEFDGTHSGVDHRMDHSLPFLYRAIR